MKGGNELKSHLVQDFAERLDITQSLLTFSDNGMPSEHLWMERLVRNVSHDAGLQPATKGADNNYIGLFLPRHQFEECEFTPPQDPNERKHHFDPDELRENQRHSIGNVMVLSPESPRKNDNFAIPNWNRAPNSQRRALRQGVDAAVRNSAA